MKNDRDFLICTLLDWYPYRPETWYAKSTGALWAIYLRGKPEPKKAKPTKEEYERIPTLGDPDYQPRMKVEDGVTYILADSGEYVELID